MKSLEVILWITAVACLIAVPFIFLPWSVVKAILLLFSIEPLPDMPFVIYLFRTACGLIGLIGVFFIILARNPLKYGPMLDLAAYGMLLFGLLSLIMGVAMGIAPIIFVGDTLSGILLGTAIRVLSSKARQERTS